ncbi:MAG: GNAT family N-acetyltransferase [Actinobacteria bacterium]|nr:GNAT family N-acetyltransferase [Actinomycetota bacterium]MBU1494234.1 GNAT family N-acetyltransferase [Actinomycetota bacterium]
MEPLVVLREAEPDEAELLASLSQRSFDSDIEIGAPGPGGPPGYDDPAWQRRMMQAGDYYCLLVEGAPVGGAIVFAKGGGACELARLFVEPSRCRRGIGTAAVRLLMERYPQATRWILDTPAWNPRTRGFYERLGFTAYGSVTLDDGLELALYEKSCDRLF